ncbi:MAG: hypothetical protein Q9227_007467 [Pyrenula ochraceoflavens]
MRSEMPPAGAFNGVDDTPYTKAELHQILSEDKTMPIAIVGMACRLPGTATSPDRLWEMISSKQAGWSEMPKDRINLDGWYHPDGERAGNLNCRAGHFLEQDLATFDASFFQISPAEAKCMDPQQRLLLECVFESMESGGIPLEKFSGSDTSCYVGCFSRDYYEILGRDVETAPLYSSTGNASAILSNRISYFYNFKGPSVTLDTACSSSLVALHLGCQSLRAGESKCSVIGATNLVLAPDVMVCMSKLHFLSPDSLCYTYDSRANGYSRGEGIAAIILKPLADAIADNDVIRAVIRGSACNQDGKTSGITLPSQSAQETLIRDAYEAAGCDPSQTSYFEAHGTGTQAGDPIEAGAIGNTLGQRRPMGHDGKRQPLYVGSVKTNVGHTEGASGLAGVIKAVLSLEHGAIPPNLNYESPNPQIDFDGWNIRVPTELMPWPHNDVRRVSVNSFGFGGTNGHVIMDDAFHYLSQRRLKASHRTASTRLQLSNGQVLMNGSNQNGGHDGLNGNINGHANGMNGLINGVGGHTNGINGHASHGAGLINGNHEVTQQFNADPHFRILFWSTHEKEIGAKNAAQYAAYLRDRKETNDQGFMDDLSYTLCSRRSMLPWKSFIVANTKHDLVEKIATTRQQAIRIMPQTPCLAYIFTGQGAQWFAMGRELARDYPVYAKSLAEADEAVQGFGAKWSLLEELMKSERDSRVDDPIISQPACTAVQIALINLLAQWGVKPQKVIGHSSGEIAAAYAAGFLPLNSAMKIAYFRGVYSSLEKQERPGQGAMMAAGISAADAEERIARVDPSLGKAVVACINSPSNVTLSGDEKVLKALSEDLKNNNFFNRFLKVKTAYHSHHMESVAADYEAALADLTVSPSQPESDIVMISTVTGRPVQGESLGPKYWVKNMVSPVQFNDGLQYLCLTKTTTGKKRPKRTTNKAAVDILIELGPHSALAGPIKQILGVKELEKADIAYKSVLARGQDARVSTLEAVAFLFAKGCNVDLYNVNFPVESKVKPTLLVDLPPYFWNHSKRHWTESRLSTEHRFRRHGRADFLGYPVSDWNPMEPKWRNLVRLHEQPWIKGHEVQGACVYPGTGYIAMAFEAMRHLNAMSPDANTNVGGYRIRDFKITRALVVPNTEEGIETVFSLQQHKDSTAAFSSLWYDFRVYSWSSDGWATHAHGRVCTVYGKRSESVDAAEIANNDLSSTVESCSRNIPSQEIYTHLANAGLVYEMPFDNLIEVKSTDNFAVGVVKVPKSNTIMPGEYEYPHLVHPGTMDSFIQTMFPALSHPLEEVKTPYLPTSIEDIFVSSEISREPGHEFRCVTKANFTAPREATTDMVITSNEDYNKPVLHFSGVKCTALGSGEGRSDSAETQIRKLCFNARWAWDPDLVPYEVASRKMWDVVVDPEEPDRVAELESLCHWYYHQALETIAEDEIVGMHDHHQKFYRYMQYQRQQVKNGKIAHQTPDWQNWNDPVVHKKMKALEARLEKSGSDAELIVRVGRKLPQVLTKSVDALALMMEDELLYKYYGAVMDTTIITHVAALLCHKNPDMKILEIGGGTGGATRPILDALGEGNYPRFKSYTFTDISSGFFDEAEEQFKGWKGLMDFKRLNIENDPASQGFEAGQYDLVVAAAVLHATTNLDVTMTNVRKLLKPGGTLVMVEMTHLLEQIFVAFGCLPGWWMSEEEDRQWGPCVDEEHWNKVLRRNGFSDIIISAPNSRKPEDEMGRVMTAVAVDDQTLQLEKLNASRSSAVIISEHSSSPLVQCVLEDLGKQGIGARVAALSDLKEELVNDTYCICLEELHRPVIRNMTEPEFRNLKLILKRSRGLLWLTHGACHDASHPENALIHGMARTLREEYVTLPIVTADFEDIETISPGKFAEELRTIFGQIVRSEVPQEYEYRYKDGCWWIKRCLETVDVNQYVNQRLQNTVVSGEDKMQPLYQKDRPLKLTIKTPGLLDTLTFDDDHRAMSELGPDDVEVEVKASGVNFRDIMICTGQLSDSSLGLESAGIVSRVGSNVTHLEVGQRVNAWTYGDYRTHVHNPASMVQPIPDDMSFEVAASLPIVFCTAIYGLVYMARLRPKDKVLIHAAAGGVGQAAIILCKHIGAEVFVTVGTQAKRELLQREFGIPEDHIFNSRNLSFASSIKQMTGNRGVDVVLNSLAGEALDSTWDCIAPFGRFIEMGKKDLVDNRNLPMAPFLRNVMFASIDLITIFKQDQALASELLTTTMDMLRRGEIRPIPSITTFNFTEIENAFRFIQAGKHTGKIVLTPLPTDNVRASSQPVKSISFDENATYILSGGFGGLGRSMARWMAGKGARNLVFVSRSGAKHPESMELLSDLEKAGVHSEILLTSVVDEKDLKSSFAKLLPSLPPVKGVVQLAMVLEDQIFENMSLQTFNNGIQPKVHGSWNLHEATLDQPLDFFVILASALGQVGNSGQANYAAGNAYEDALVHYRVARGLPATSIDLGMMLAIGSVAEDETGLAQRNLERKGFVGINEAEYLALLEKSLMPSCQSVQDQCQMITGIDTDESKATDTEVVWKSDPIFSHLKKMNVRVGVDTDTAAVESVQALLHATTSFNDAVSIILNSILQRMSRSLMIELADLDSNQPPSSYGVDSLIAVELRNWFAKEIKADVAVFEILQTNSIQSLGFIVAEKSMLIEHAKEG